MSPGDLLKPKESTNVWNSPMDDRVIRLGQVKSDNIVMFLGDEKIGFLKVYTPVGVGWIHKTILQQI
jgi:hypothetical protein